jgi:hypothetical protein
MLDSTHSFATGSAATQIARHAFDDDHAFLQQDQLRPRLHVEYFGVGEKLAQEISHRDFFGRAPLDRLTDGAHCLRKFFDRMVRWDVARFEMDGGGAVIIARDEAVQNFREEAALG